MMKKTLLLEYFYPLFYNRNRIEGEKMQCGNCGTPLIPGNNICPSCGALNMGFTPQNSNTEDKSVLNSSPIESNEGTNVNEQAVESSLINQALPVENENQVHQETSNDISDVKALGESQIQNDPDKIETLENQVPQDIPPVSLTFEENLTQGVKEMNEENISTYAPEQQNTPEQKEEGQVSIQIPEVEKPIENIQMPSDGSALSVDEVTETVGEVAEESTLKIGKTNFKIKFPKGKKISMRIFIIALIITLVVGALLGRTLFKQNVCVSSTPKSTKTKTPLVSDGKNNITKAGNYLYTIPKSLNYDKKDGGIVIYDEAGSYRIFIRDEAGLYENLASSRTSITETLKENEMTVNNSKEMKIKEKSYLIFEGTTKLQNRLVVFSEATNDHIFYMEIVNTSNNYDYQALEVADDIIKNAKYEEKENELENIGIYDISEVSITAAEAYQAIR